MPYDLCENVIIHVTALRQMSKQNLQNGVVVAMTRHADGLVLGLITIRMIIAG